MYRITIFIYERVLNRGQNKKSAVFFWTEQTSPSHQKCVTLFESAAGGEGMVKINEKLLFNVSSRLLPFGETGEGFLT